MNLLKFSGIIFIALCINGYETVNAACVVAEVVADSAEQVTILDHHNKLRAAIVTGGTTKGKGDANLPAAAALEPLKWDAGTLDKAALGKITAETCAVEATSLAFNSGDIPASKGVQDVLDLWSATGKKLSLTEEGNLKETSGADSIAFINMIYSKATKVGCAIGALDEVPTVLVCNYADALTAVDDGLQVYEAKKDEGNGGGNGNGGGGGKNKNGGGGTDEPGPGGDGENSSSRLEFSPVFCFACLVVSTILLFAY